jgi:hypothetical protein
MVQTRAARRVVPARSDDFWLLATSFKRALLARNLSGSTIRIYTTSVEQLGAFLTTRGGQHYG